VRKTILAVQTTARAVQKRACETILFNSFPEGLFFKYSLTSRSCSGVNVSHFFKTIPLLFKYLFTLKDSQ